MKKLLRYLLLLLLAPFFVTIGLFIFLAYDFVSYQAGGHTGSRPRAPTAGLELFRALPLGASEDDALSAVRRHRAIPYDEPNDYVAHLFQYLMPGKRYWPKFSDGDLEIFVEDGKVSGTRFDFAPAPASLQTANGPQPAPDCAERYAQTQARLQDLFGPAAGSFQVDGSPVTSWSVAGGRLYLSAFMGQRVCAVSASAYSEGGKACQDNCHLETKP